MKKFVFAIIFALAAAATLPAAADDNRPITIAELPRKAQQFIATHFAGMEVSYATVDTEFFDKDYKVLFVNGAKVTFSKSGDWTEVDCKRGEVPASVVPDPIRDEAKRRFPAQHIVQIEQSSRDYEIELGNGIEMRFDRSLRLMGIDD